MVENGFWGARSTYAGGPHRWDAARRPVLEAKSQVYEPTRPSTEPEFSPLLLLRNHQMLATTRPRCATRMPRVRTPYGQPVPLQPDPANVLGTLSSEPCLTMASRVTLVHRGAQLDVPRSHNPSAHQLQTPITLFVQLHAIMPVHNHLDICAGCVSLIIFGLALRSSTWTRSSTWNATPQLRACDHGPSSARWSGFGSGGRK